MMTVLSSMVELFKNGEISTGEMIHRMESEGLTTATPAIMSSSWSTFVPLMESLFRFSFSEDNGDIDTVTLSRALEMMEKIAEEVIREEKEGKDNIFKRINRSNLDQNTRTMGYTHILIALGKGISTDNNAKISSLDKAFSRQEEIGLKIGKSSGSANWPLVDLLVPFEPSQVVEVIERILRQPEICWENVMLIVSHAIRCFKGIDVLLAEISSSLISKGLNDSNFRDFKMGLLLSRQGCLEKSEAFFSSYSTWFARSFGDEGTSLATPHRRYSQLISFLTELVPIECAMFMKCHVSGKHPFLPAQLNHTWTDYTKLVKTRILDLANQKAQQKINDGAKAASFQGRQDLEEDVSRALENFDKNGKIPQTVMEASIFRKPYFANEFVPCLLRIRPRTGLIKRFLQELVRTNRISQKTADGKN